MSMTNSFDYIIIGAGSAGCVLAKPVAAGPQAWVCRGPQCLAPLADTRSLLACLTRDEADA